MEEDMIESALDKFIDTPSVSKEEESKVQKEDKKEKSSKLKKFWNRTIFPDMIREKREEKREKNKIKREAKLEAMKELKPELIKHIKQQELDKLTGKKKKDFLEKMAKGFEGVGKNMDVEKLIGTSGQVKTKDISGMMGMGGNQNKQQNNMFSDEKMKSLLSGRDTGVSRQDKINQMLGTKQKDNQEEETLKNTPVETPEEKIKRLLE